MKKLLLALVVCLLAAYSEAQIQEDNNTVSTKELQTDKNHGDSSKKLILTSTACITIILLSFGWYLAYRMNRKKDKILSSEISSYKKKLEDAFLREEKLKLEIDIKNKELASYTINFVQKNDLLEELKRTLQSVNPNGFDAAKKITSLNKIIERGNQVDREWKDFKIQFENVHQNFFKALKAHCPDLTNGDMKLCTLLKLNMNMKEAANVLGISPESVKTARYRLRKKFGLSPNENLVDFMLSLEWPTEPVAISA